MFFYVKMWIMDPEVDSRLSGHVLWPHISGSHLFDASPDEYMIWIFWELTSGIISVCSALGSTVDTCSCQSTRLWGVSHSSHVNVNSDPEVTPWLSLSTETGTHSANCAAALAQVQLLDNLLTRYVQRHARCFARQVHYWSRQCIWRFCSCLSGGRPIPAVLHVVLDMPVVMPCVCIWPVLGVFDHGLLDVSGYRNRQVVAS